MTKKWFSILVLLVAFVAMLAMTADASKRPYDPRVEKARYAKISLALDDGRGEADAAARGGQTVSLGTAQPNVDSRGALIAQTWRDWHANSTIGRVVDNNPAGTLAGVQFSFMSKASALAINVAKWAYNAYIADPGLASFAFPGGTVVVQAPNDANQAGSYPRIQVMSNGFAVFGSYDFLAGTTGPTQMQIVWDDGIANANFGEVTDGTVMSNTVRATGNISGASAETIWPAMAVTESGGQTVIYLFAYENAASGNGAVKVFRKVGLTPANPDATWTMVFADTSFFPTTDICASKTGTRVACTWTKSVPNDGPQGYNVWMAHSPTGLSGSWTRVNVSNYTANSAGYRAWLEATCLMDSADKIHVVWNGNITDGTSGNSRSCRLFHWSEYNPANRYTMVNAEFDVSTTECWGGSNVLNVGKFSVAECDGRLYSTFTSWNNPALVTNLDDCCASSAVNLAANGELYVTISKDLQGKSWDKPRNLSNSYTPACDTGNCTDDRWGGLSRYGIDNADFAGTEIWPTAATYDLGTGLSTEKSVQVFYCTDRYPGGGVLGTPQGPLTNNDMRWIRLLCVPPVTAAALAVNPGAIEYPEFTKPGIQKNLTLTLENTGNTTLTMGTISVFEDSTKPSGLPTGWLGVTGAPASILEAESAPATLQLNKGGVVVGQPRELWGRVVFNYTTPAQSLTLPVHFVVADTVKPTRWETLSTACTDLTVSTNGNMGNAGSAGVGKANMDYAGTALECDTGGNGRGDANIFLYDGSPVIVRKTGATTYVASWAIFSDGFTDDRGFKPLAGFAAEGKVTSNAKFDLFNSGTFCTVDSLVKVQKTWIAPKGLSDSCKFIIQKMMVFPYTIGTSVSGLAIGEAIDWDVPSDSGGSGNVGGNDPNRRLVWQRGFQSADTVTDCRANNLRYAGMALLYTHTKNCTLDSTLYGGFTAANDTFVYPEGTFVPERLWANMQATGYTMEGRTTDLHAVLVYKNGAANAGFTLPANDTLTIYTALATIPNAATQAAGLDSLQKQMDRAKKFFHSYKATFGAPCFQSGPCCCSQATRGNVNQAGIIDLSDLSLLIAYLTATVKPTLPCPPAANVNGAGIIDLSDLSLLIAYLTATVKPTLPPCGCP